MLAAIAMDGIRSRSVDTEGRVVDPTHREFRGRSGRTALDNHASRSYSDDSVESDTHLVNTPKRKSFAGFSTPLTFQWFISVYGVEHCHTYFWIAKDLAWMQGLREPSVFFGLLALAWSLLILYHSMRTTNWHELWNFVALFLWLFANFIWMKGEAHDYEYPDAIPIAKSYSNTSAQILQFALLWELVYYLVCIPFGLIHTSKAALREYDDGHIPSRWSIFSSFRQYENLHTLVWIAKDLAWNVNHLVFWLVCLFPTFFIAIDLLVIVIYNKEEDYTVDVVHFAITLVWVIANTVWAFGDFFIEKYDKPLDIWDISEDSLMTARWYAAWILFLDMICVFVMYGVWSTLTIVGKLGSAVDADYHKTHAFLSNNSSIVSLAQLEPSASATALAGISTTTNATHSSNASNDGRAVLELEAGSDTDTSRVK